MTRALLLLACALAPALARAGPPEPPRRADPGQESRSVPPEPSAEDREVIENLDLLQAMDGAQDLELLLELNQADDGEGD